ncbi:MAG TPA: alpha/beta fold hydrolase [Usitatibacter sp.]|nr:alpha/beta fold hydrolase [Usitatibacter sp.]
MRDRQDLRFCTSQDGTRLAYASSGSGPALVKTANWLSHLEYDRSSPIWRHWIEGLSRHRTYYRYDQRGCGLSDRNPPEMSFESWVRDLEAVVDAAKLERFPLLGISQGGAIAIDYATRHPDRVSHLILYGAFARGRLKRGGGQAAIDETMTMYKLFELGWGTDNRAFRRVFATQFLPGASHELIDAFDDLQRHSATAADAVRLMQVSVQIDVARLCERVQCPTLILHGRDDGRIPFEEGRRIASAIPGARFVPLESGNHILLADEPMWPAFLREIDAFLGDGKAARRLADLTPRENELVELLARGLDNHQIAAHLELSEKTVRNMVSSVLDKLGVESRAQAIVRARDAGYGVGSPA